MKESEGEVTQGEAVSFDRSDRVLPGEPANFLENGPRVYLIALFDEFNQGYFLSLHLSST